MADEVSAKKHFFSVSLHPNVHSLPDLRLRTVDDARLLDHSVSGNSG